MRARFGVGAPLLGLGLLGVSLLATRPLGAQEALPPPQLPPPLSVEDLRPRVAPAPQWDLGLAAGVCGTGREELWQSTYFCTNATVDVSFLRKREPDGALGFYGSVGTVGFVDGRYGLGAFGLLPVGDLFNLQLSVGPSLKSDGTGVSPGLEGRLSWGLRSLNQTGHYGHTHALVLGVDHTPGDDARAGTALSILLRVDAFWFGLPLGLLF